MSNRLDEPTIGKFSNRSTSKRAVDFELFDHVVHSDGLHLLGYFLDHLVEQSLVVHDKVVLLISDLALGPFLHARKTAMLNGQGSDRAECKSPHTFFLALPLDADCAARSLASLLFWTPFGG